MSRLWRRRVPESHEGHEREHASGFPYLWSHYRLIPGGWIDRQKTTRYYRSRAARRKSITPRDAHANRGHVTDLRKAGPRGLLVRRSLGRRDVRRLHSIRGRGPVGSAPPYSQGDAEYASSNALPWPEHPRIRELRRRCR